VECAAKTLAWAWFERDSSADLGCSSNTHMQSVRTKVEKVSMSPAVVHGSGGPTPTALLFAKRLGWFTATLESVKGKSANIPIPSPGDSIGNPATKLETAARTPVKSSLFLLMGTQDHGSESIERRWSLRPGQRVHLYPWVEIRVAQGKSSAALLWGLSVPRTAAGLLGQEPLVNGTM